MMEEKCLTCVDLSLKSSTILSKIKVLNLPTLPEGFLNLNFITKDVSEPCLGFDILTEKPEAVTIQNDCAFPLANGPVFFPSIVSVIPLTKDDDVKDIVDISLDFSGCGVEFQCGDTVGIIPSNCLKEVQQILDCLHITEFCDLKYALSVKQGTSKKKSSIPPYLPTNSTIRHVLETCLDIRSVPKKLFLRVLAEYTSDSIEKRRLQELCSKEGAKEYSQFIVESRNSLLDILKVFPTCHPPVERLFEFLPRLHARPYSLASSPLVEDSVVHIVFSLITFPGLNLCPKKYGLCTKWLYSMSTSYLPPTSLTEQFAELGLENIAVSEYVTSTNRIPMFLRKSSGFCLPKDPSVPLILIGPGTGIAPFIGFLQHRKHELEVLKILNVGEIWLFSGCRYSDKDFIFEAQINDFIKNKVLTRFFMCFSREKREGHARYVQDYIKLYSKDFVTQLLDKKSSVFVCGDAKNMAKDVWETIIAVLQTEKNMSKEEAHEVLFTLKSEQRYLQDIWI